LERRSRWLDRAERCGAKKRARRGEAGTWLGFAAVRMSTDSSLSVIAEAVE
jgi:hypothetical protein